MPPQLPLGSTASIALGAAAKPWQVVGYIERRDVPSDPEEDSTFWREYLLYHRHEGFAFLVDAEDGWSWVVPIAGVPQGSGDRVQWRGTPYLKRTAYEAETTYVLGESYWKVERGQRSFNTDYAAAKKRLNREQALPDGEVTWSAGATLDASAVARAFRIPEAQRAALARDTGPLAGSASGFSGLRAVVLIVVALIVVAVLMARCSRDDCDELRRVFGAASNEYRECVRTGSGSTGLRSRGGSYGGYGTGGSHK